MSEQVIASLERQLAKANAEAARYREERARLKKQLEPLQAELDALKASAATLATDRDGWKAKAEAAPSELALEVERLKGEVRTRDHRAVFDRIAKEAGVGEKALAGAWKLLGYTPAADAVDEAQIKELVGNARDEHPYLFPPAADAAARSGESTQSKRTLTGAVGADRGSPDNASARVVVRRSDCGDPEWMRANQSKIAQASKEGLLQFVD